MEEYILRDDEFIVSKTNLQGVITYVNESFISASGFSREELIGKNHNIVRHSEMPKAAFKQLWSTVKEDKPWNGIVKNRRKDGGFYWVNAYIVPIYEGGQKVGYMSVRTKPTNEQLSHAKRLYATLNSTGKDLPTFYKKTISLKNKMIALSAVLSLFVGGMGIYQSRQVESITSEYSNIRDNYTKTIRLAQGVGGSIDKIRVNMFAAVQHGVNSPYLKYHNHGIDKHQKSINEAIVKIKELHEKFLDVKFDEESKQQALSIYEEVKKVMPELDKINGMVEADKVDLLAEKIFTVVTPLSEKISKQSADLAEQLKAKSDKGYSHTQDLAQQVFYLNLVASIGITIGLLLFTFLTVKTVMIPIEKTQRIFKNISQGQLSNEVNIGRDDEIGSLLMSIASMQVNLKTLIDEVYVTSRSVNEYTVKLEESMTRIYEASEEQSSKSMSISSASEEVSSTVGNIAENAVQTASLSTKTYEVTEHSISELNKSMQHGNKVIEDVQHAEKTLNNLIKSLEQIFTIKESIKAISEKN